MVQKSYLRARQTTKTEKDGWKQLDASDKIKTQIKLELNKKYLIDVELAESSNAVYE